MTRNRHTVAAIPRDVNISKSLPRAGHAGLGRGDRRYAGGWTATASTVLPATAVMLEVWLR